jgi:addiction module HigA family antidote
MPAEPAVKSFIGAKPVLSLKEFSMPKSSQTPAAILQSLMDEYQLNPFSLAKAVHLSHSAVRLLAIGKSKLSVSTALRLAKFFGQDPAYWLDLQREADLNEASKDNKLQGILKAITKAKKPAAPKPETAKKSLKKQTLSDKRKKAAKAPGAKAAKGSPAKKAVKKSI